jgi:GT2 family glycosyltransferase
LISQSRPPLEHAPRSLAAGHVSVVIVNWNHIQVLPRCLETIDQQTYPHVDICVVDNASQDGSAQWIQTHTPHIHLIHLEANRGFSYAFNQGVRTSNGEFVLSLNPDVRARPDFIFQMIVRAQSDPQIGMVAPKLLRADDPRRLDSTGLFLNRQRRPYDRGQMQTDSGQYDARTEIFGACGAAAFYRRAMLEDLTWEGEYFDEDFFAYYEDADLAWRAKLRGWRSIYAPEAVAEHIRGWGDTLRKSSQKGGSLGPRLALRNRYLMLVKNDTFFNFLVDSPWILLPEIPRILFIALFRSGALAAIPDFLKLWPRARKKRREIQKSRAVSNREMRKWFEKKADHSS